MKNLHNNNSELYNEDENLHADNSDLYADESDLPDKLSKEQREWLDYFYKKYPNKKKIK